MADWKVRALSVARSLGAFRLAERLTRRQLRILCYHGVWLNADAPNPFNFLYMRSETFTARMAALKRLGYPVLPLDEALRRLGDGSLPDNAVAITIDDGWVGTATHMVPELRHHGFPATIYYTTYHAQTQTAVFGVALNYLLQSSGLPHDALIPRLPSEIGIDRSAAQSPSELHRLVSDYAETLTAPSRDALLESIAEGLGIAWAPFARQRSFMLMSLAEANKLAGDGIDFQLHTHRHRVTHEGRCCIGEELADNRACLAEVDHGVKRHFCYPSGRWQPEHFSALHEAGVESATTTDTGFVDVTSHRLALPRILDGDRMGELEFEAELSGLLELKRRLTRAVRRRLGRS